MSRMDRPLGTWGIQNDLVITSYSIHYTKLYDGQIALHLQICQPALVQLVVIPGAEKNRDVRPDLAQLPGESPAVHRGHVQA